MQFYWVLDPVKHKNKIHIYWGPGKLHFADLYSKHLYNGNKEQCNALVSVQRECVNPAPMLGP
jgi:hypothetical protein